VIDHRGWMTLASEEYRRISQVLVALTPEQWLAPTDCTGWQVRDIVAHLIGTAEASARIREQLRQQRIGAKDRGTRLQIDAVNDLQVRERAHLSPTELREQLAEAGQRAIRARTRMPKPIRALRFRFPPPLGRASLGYLSDTIYTRDAWMHRIDICRAAGHHLQLTTEHDGAIVADAARAWQQAGGPSNLNLTGPIGCTLRTEHPSTSSTASFDAVELARALSGREQLPGVPSDAVLF
jgi:uncharacterized protein (TIGR03083 family)